MTDKQTAWFDALKTITQMKVLVQSLGLTPQEEVKFWQELLKLLQSETSPMEVEEKNSLFGFITSTADLKDVEVGDKLYSELYSTLKEMIENDEQDSFWNESVYKLIKFFIEKVQNKDDKIVENLDLGYVTIDMLKKADAGNNFPGYRNNNPRWVFPWLNIDGEDYDEVRKHDEVLEILKNYSKLQYTRRPDNDDTAESEILSKWIRLLMPQYGRRVEVEDLNRNFWVITQTIAAISAYLFSEDSPLPKMLEGLLRETTEIWENIIYLWTGIAAISQNVQSGVQTIVLPLQTRYNEHGRQYDNFDVDLKSYANFDPSKDWYAYDKDDKGYVKIVRGDNFNSEVIKRIGYLAEQYSDRNLCVIPYIRLENYKHNYYSGEWYPGIYMYDQLKKEWTSKIIKEAPEAIPIGGESLVYQIESPEDLFKRYCYIETELTEAELNEEKRQFEFYINETLANPYSARFTKKNDKICVFLDFGDKVLDERDTVSLKTFVGDDVEKVVIQYKNPSWHGETTPDQLVDIDGSYKAIMSNASSWCYNLQGSGYLYYYKDPSVWANDSKIWEYPIHIKEEDLPDWVENTEGDSVNQNGWILLQWVDHGYDAYMCQSYGALKNNKYWKDRYTVKIEVRNGSTDEKWYDLLKDRGNIGNIIINVHHLEEGETGRPAAFIILLNGGSTDFTVGRGIQQSLMYKDPNAHDTSISGDYYSACPAEYRITIYNAPNYTPPGEPKVYSTKIAPVNYFHIPNKNFKNWKQEEGKYVRHFYLGEEEITTEQYSITTMNWLKQICVQQETEPIYIWTNIPINDSVRLTTETVNGEVIFEERELVISPRYEEIYEDSVDGTINKRFSDKIFAAKQDDDGRILWAYPYDKLANVESDGRITLYGSLRTVPYVDCLFKDNQFEINDIKFMISDPASEAIGEGKRVLGGYNHVAVDAGGKDNVLYFQYTPEILTPVEANPMQLYSSDASTANEGYYMGEVASWKGKTAEVVESENLFNDVAYVLKVGNYLPEQGTFTMASVQSNGFRFTSMRGNVTKSYNSKATDSNADTWYYKFRWDTYNGKNDGTPDDLVENNNTICYGTAPEKKSSRYPTRKQIAYDGLIAAKKFLEVNDLLKQPCYLITAIGLTPWSGTGRTGRDVYWDSAFIPAIYYYVPSPETISGQPEGTPGYNVENYKAAYTDEGLKAINLSTDGIETIEGYSGSGIVMIDGKEVGKIVLCAPIERYEGYFHAYDCSPDPYYPHGGSHWRQFYVTNHSEGNTCHAKTFNGGPGQPDGSISYTATFSSIFEGTVEYFDVERHMVSEPRVTLRYSKQSKCAEAKVKIDSVRGYQQIEDGKIVDTSTINTLTYEDKPSISYLAKNTGFQQRLNGQHQVDGSKNDIYGLISKLGETGYTNAEVFAGGTPLDRSPNTYCIYKV